VRFNGTPNSNLVAGGWVAPAAQAKTLFFVFNQVSPSAYAGLASGLSNPNSNTYAINGTGPLQVFAGNVVTGGSVTAAATFVVEYNINGAASYVSVNGTKSSTFNPGAQTWTSFLNIGFDSTITGGYFDGDLSDIVIYAGNASTADAQSVGAALCTLRGVTCGTGW
jgi:hypothetical protein